MKIPVSIVRATIVTFFIIPGLIAHLTSCSSTQPVPDAHSWNQTPIIEEDTTPISEPVPEIRVKQNHPVQYTVKKGDTLWDISSLFLQDPWYWPEIWQRNQQVENPHLIFPGDVLSLMYVEGQPRILVEAPGASYEVKPTRPASAPPVTARPGPNLPVRKLVPSVYRNDIAASIPSIPSDAIRQFLTRPRIVTLDELEEAPYILGSDDNHLILAQDNRVYIRGELDKERVRFTVFRPGKKLIDPVTDEVFGYEAIYAGEVHIKKYDDPAVGILTATEREVLIGDRLLPLDKSAFNNQYFPKVPDRKLNGQVISLFDALFGVAKHQIAVVNLGARDGVEDGHLLATYTKGRTVRDNFDLSNKGGKVKFPDERSGLLMIFRTFDSVSYGLVMSSTNVIRRNDVVGTPR